MIPFEISRDEFDILVDCSIEDEPDDEVTLYPGMFGARGIQYEDDGQTIYLIHTPDQMTLNRIESILRIHRQHAL